MLSVHEMKKIIHHKIDYLNDLDMEENTEQVFRQQTDLIEYLSTINLSEKNKKDFFADPRVKDYIKKHQTFTSRWEVYLENLMNQWLVTCSKVKNEKFLKEVRQHYIEIYQTSILNQAKLAEINKNDCVCHVGIGDMPLSLLLLRKYTHNKIIGLDIIASVIRNASQYIFNKSKKNPADCNFKQFELHHCDGNLFSYHEPDVIIISAAVKNKQAVLDQIIKSKKIGYIRVIIREIRDFCFYLYQDSPVSLEQIPHKKLGEHCNKLVNSTAYLI